jgi:hypothetical protein
MWGVILSGVNTALSFVFRSIVVKFVFYFALFFFVSEAISYLASTNIFPNGNSLTSLLQGLSPSIWWGLDLVAFDVGLPMVLGAYVTGKLITMIPVIGGR